MHYIIYLCSFSRQRHSWREERKLNSETFGISENFRRNYRGRSNWRGGNTRGGWRGGRGRGGGGGGGYNREGGGGYYGGKLRFLRYDHVYLIPSSFIHDHGQQWAKQSSPSMLCGILQGCSKFFPPLMVCKQSLYCAPAM